MSDGIREIYNEGRVVGLSAYELYVRKFYENDPNATPPTEKAWLASMFGNGNAMILKLTNGTQAGVQDFELPAGSALCGSNTLLASVFNGDCAWAETAAISDTGAVGYWAEAVTSYGGLINNTSTSYPSSSSIPYSDSVFDDPADRQNIINFCKIAEGISIQRGEWVDSTTGTPYKDLTNPAFGTSPTIIRLYITQPLSSDVKLLITGFLDSEFASTISGLQGSTDPLTNGHLNGEFLGPAIFPWSAKILFIYPNLANIVDNQFERQLPNGTLDSDIVGSYDLSGQDSKVGNSPVVDLDTVDPGTYYQVNGSKYSGSVIPVNVEAAETSKGGMNVLAVYEPGMTARKVNIANASTDPDSYFFPPALYAGKISSTGVQNMVPVDTAAPGTVKVFDTLKEASTYPQQVPNNYAFHYDTTNLDLTLYAKNGTTIGPINSKLSVSKKEPSDANAVVGKIKASGNELHTVALSNTAGVDYPTTGSSGIQSITTADAGISWDNLLSALANNKKLDVLGQALKQLRDNLPNITITGDVTADEGSFSGGIHIQFSDIYYDPTIKGIHLSGNDGDNLKVDGKIIGSDGVDLEDKYVSKRIVTKVLPANSSQPLVIEDASFTTTGYYDVYTSKYGVNPKTITPSAGSVSLTFKPQSTPITVGVRCYERLS